MSTVVVHLLPPNECPFGLGRPKCNSMVAAMSEYNYDLWEDRWWGREGQGEGGGSGQCGWSLSEPSPS